MTNTCCALSINVANLQSHCISRFRSYHHMHTDTLTHITYWQQIHLQWISRIYQSKNRNANNEIHFILIYYVAFVHICKCLFTEVYYCVFIFYSEMKWNDGFFFSFFIFIYLFCFCSAFWFSALSLFRSFSLQAKHELKWFLSHTLFSMHIWRWHCLNVVAYEGIGLCASLTIVIYFPFVCCIYVVHIYHAY